MDAFKIFITDEMLNEIVLQTNSYAKRNFDQSNNKPTGVNKVPAGLNGKNSTVLDWKHVLDCLFTNSDHLLAYSDDFWTNSGRILIKYEYLFVNYRRT